MKALINAINQNSVVCRVAKDSLSKALISNNFIVNYDSNDYRNYDLIIFFSTESNIKEVRKINSKAIVGILDPKLNNKLQYDEAKNADFLVVSSIEQQLFAEKFNNNVIIYNWFSEVVLNKDFKSKYISKEKKLRIGYQGNKIHLNAFNPTLKKTFEKLYKHFEFIEFVPIYDIKNLGKWKIGRPKIPVFDAQWNLNDYCQILSTCDIGIVPNLLPINKYIGHNITQVSLRKSDYNYNKNDYLTRFKLNSNPNRFWEFSQLKIPVVADLYPSSCQILDHNINGFLAYDEHTWFNSLKILIEKPDLRNDFGDRLNKKMNSNFSIEINKNNFINFLFDRFNILKPVDR